jgi:hypothetical protein
VGENLDVTSNLAVSGDVTVSGNVEMSSNLTVSGNIGVGTTNPGFSLDVHGTANVGALTTTSLSIKDDPHPELNFNFTNSNNSKWLQQAKLTAGADAGASDNFGYNVSISSDGSTAIVGAYADDDNGQSDSGSAYIFVGSGGTWTQQQKLTAGADAGNNDQFGRSVSISSDGDTAIVGAYLDDDNGEFDSGSAYIFVRSGGTWTQQAKLTAGVDAGNNDRFGHSVSISSDGSTAVVGAYLDDDNGQSNSGSAYIFVRSGGTWTQQAKLTAGTDAGGADYFGFRVSISGDGSTVIVGAYQDDDNGQSGSGSAYIFVGSGGTWTQQAKLTAGADAGASDNFGYSVSISSDGSTAIVGARYDDDNGQSNSGSAYIFVRSGGTWTQQRKLTAEDASANDHFGYSVSISSDGNIAIVGARYDDDNGQSNSGSAYIFVRSGGTWTQQQKLTAGEDAGFYDQFGFDVSISSDGSTAIVGAYWDDDNGQSDSGSAYIFNAERAVHISKHITTSGFAVLDEAHESEEFPPGVMTDYETYMDGHGVFRAYASTDYGETPYRSWNAFDKTITTVGGNNGWASAAWTWDNAGSTTPDTSNVVVFDGVQCHWLALELPYAINPEKVTLQSRNDSNVPTEVPKIGRIYGSNDRNTWTKLKDYDITSEVSVLNTSAVNEPIDINLTTNEYYKHLLLTVDERYGGNEGAPTWTAIGDLRYFGTRERGQSTLHDGELKLSKNLTVPRIGPPLDTDDTPRRDRLVVEYNTSTNPMENGVVRDTSGNGLDGVLENTYSPGNATYDPYYDTVVKALVFDGSNDYVTKNLTGISGDFIFSASLWVYHESSTNNVAQFFTIGNNATNQMVGFRLNSSMTSAYVYFYSGDTLTATISTVLFKWNHFVVTYDGSTQRLYQNGVFVKSDSGSGLNLPQDPELRIGHRPSGGSTEYLDGYLSNFKLYDVALTTEEVKRLYYMGRCDEGHHVVNFSKTRVGIGLAGGEAPYDELDVRGNVRGSENVIVGPPGGQWWRLYTFQHNGNLGFLGEDGTEHGYLVDSGTVSNIDFTGQHRAVVDNINVSDYENFEGLIVSANKNKYINVDKDITTGSNAIQISQSLPVVSLSNVVHDKACYGVISGSEEVDSRTYEQGTFVSVFQKQKGDTRAFINSVGEGAMWVVNTAGPLESGDYITTSNVAGYGQKQDDDILHNYTVAKITMDCDFDPVTQPLQVIKKDEDGVNVLDEHGQLQWEDHPTETEKAYKIRYLDATGVQTDEANAVHIAAFVGCTYHCG